MRGQNVECTGRMKNGVKTSYPKENIVSKMILKFSREVVELISILSDFCLISFVILSEKMLKSFE